MAGLISDERTRVRAYLEIFTRPSSSKHSSTEECRARAAEELARLRPGAKLTAQRLAELTAPADVDLDRLAGELLGGK
jgi:hypothetical protein